MLRSQAVVDFGEPLQTVEFPLPVPQGREVLIRTTFAGMCHSDVHLADGYFDMGGGAKMPVREKRPFTLGHEVGGLDLPDEQQHAGVLYWHCSRARRLITALGLRRRCPLPFWPLRPLRSIDRHFRPLSTSNKNNFIQNRE